MYLFLVNIHIVSAIVSTIPVLLFIPILIELRRATVSRRADLLAIYSKIVWVIKHAGHVLITSGVLQIWVGGWSVFTPWILSSLVIILGALFFIARAFTPIINALLESGDTDIQPLIFRLARASFLYALIMIFVGYLMLAKPSLW